jgi:type VI secretion system protein ImpA
MPSLPLLPFTDLTAPIPGDEPAGDTVPFSIRQKLEEHRKEINPADFAEDDPTRPAEPKRADWPGIIRLASETLSNTSKDLLVAARLTEALAKAHGFAGARDGLHLLRLLVEQCWDRINPVIEDGDIEVRAGAFNWLDDPDRGARFPSTLRAVPLVSLEGEEYSWQQWKQLQEGRGPLKADTFDRAIQATPREHCQQTADELAETLQEVERLSHALTEKMDAVAPSLLGIRKALADCQTLAHQILERKGPAPSAAPEEEEQGEAPAQDGAAAPGRGKERAPSPVRTRADIYRQLSEAAALLQQIEPHSPIPYLIQRAVALGAMPFPQLMRELIRDDGILTEMNRELGIHEQAANSQQEQEDE